MRVLRAVNYQRMPWKNGGGETIEMIVSPERASFDDFDWRISMARVAAPGPFSQFPGIDRTLSVIAGHGLSLVVDGQTIALNRSSAPLRFSGDARVDSVLRDGAIDDLNVMTRRGRCDHRVSRVLLTTATTLRWEGEISVVVAIGSDVDLRIGSETVTLASRDAVVFDAHDAREFVASSNGEATLYLIDIFYPLNRARLSPPRRRGTSIP